MAVVAGAVALLVPGSGTAGPGAPVGPTVLAGVDAPTRTSSAVAQPTRVRMPAIGVDSTLVELRVDGDGVLVPPADFDRAGWYTGSSVPGEIGPSVIAGHVDSTSGPAVFYRLAELAVGDDVLVERADGTSVRFTVTGTERYAKDEFPTELVYRPSPRAVLQLITCGGEFDADLRSYRDNVVVTAVLA